MTRPESLYYVFSPVTRIKGVGPAVAEHIARLFNRNAETRPFIRDLLFHLPVGLVDRRVTFPLNEVKDGVIGTFIVTVHDYHAPPNTRFGKKPFKVMTGNETGDLTLVFFHAQPDYIKRALPIGETRVVSGRVEIFDYHAQMTHPDVIARASELKQVQTVEPVYPLTAGLTNRRLASIIRDAVQGAAALPEWIPPEIVSEHGWQPWKETLALAHAPQEEAELLPQSTHRMRLAFDEIFANQLHLALLRSKMQAKPGRVLKSAGSLREKLMAQLPFALTAGQRAVLTEIDADMASGSRMTRLLQGDVGSGKTVVALLAALTAAENDMQTALMVPTELVAQQHAASLLALLGDMPVNVTLLTGNVKGRQREEALSHIASGQAHIVIGTHALFQEAVTFHDLALIVIDEQHRFGVSQRMALSAKGEAPHLLQMSATPIPRSLTMTLYGDMDCSLLTEKPAERKAVTTRAIPLSRFDEVTERLKKAVENGGKAYWICPLIEEETLNLHTSVAAAEARFTLFKAMFGPQVALVHGRMKADRREAEMARFASGEARVLVATTVIEVGVDVRDATIIVIEQAERFGLAQLHQLRGRVGRGDQASACVLLYSDNAGEESVTRLMSLRDNEDGFRIAEEDLRQRGGGDLLGTRQSGLPQFYFLDLVLHRQLIADARELASRIARENPSLEGQAALQTLLALYGYEYGI